jgi:hypothetical protein
MGTPIRLGGAEIVSRETLAREGAVINLLSPRAAVNSGAIAFSLFALRVSGEVAFLVRRGHLMSTSMMDSLISLRPLFLALKIH